MDTGLPIDRMNPRGNRLRRPGQSAFVLLLVLILTSILGGTVLATQLMIQQRLHATTHRNQRYQRRIAADAAVQQLLGINRMTDETITQAVVKVGLPETSTITLAWKSAPTSTVTTPNTWWMTATVAGDNGEDALDYTVRRDGERWRMERW